MQEHNFIFKFSFDKIHLAYFSSASLLIQSRNKTMQIINK